MPISVGVERGDVVNIGVSQVANAGVAVTVAGDGLFNGLRYSGPSRRWRIGLGRNNELDVGSVLRHPGSHLLRLAHEQGMSALAAEWLPPMMAAGCLSMTRV